MVKRWIHDSCFQPPVVPGATTGGGPPDWSTTLLKTQVYIADRKCANTATGHTAQGHAVEVSLCFADPPAAYSYLCVHCPGLNDGNFAGVPRVLCCSEEGDLLLLHMSFTFFDKRTAYNDQHHEFFVYEAPRPRSAGEQPPPLLHRIPYPALSAGQLFRPQQVGILRRRRRRRRGDDDDTGCGFLLAALSFTMYPHYHLDVYSSESSTWTAKLARLDKSPVPDDHLPAIFHKVVPLGGGRVGWVNLYSGILVCNVLEDENHPLIIHHILLPYLMPGNEPGNDVYPWRFRDVSCSNGVIKFMEIEESLIPRVPAHRKRPRPCCCCLDSIDTLHDSDLAPLPTHSGADHRLHNYVSWKTVIWSRTVTGTTTSWHKECTARAEDIQVVHGSRLHELLAELGDEKSPLMNLVPAHPALSIHGHDVVYFKSRVLLDARKKWLVAMDLKNKTLRQLVPYPADDFTEGERPYRSWALSKYMCINQGGC